MAKTFSAQIEERVAAYEKRLNATVKGATQDVVEEMLTPVAKGGHMRVKTGFLRASLLGSTSSMPLIKASSKPGNDAADNSFPFNDNQVNLVIASAKIGRDTMFFGFTAGYAAPRELRDGFVRLAAQNWKKHVNTNAKKAIRAFP